MSKVNPTSKSENRKNMFDEMGYARIPNEEQLRRIVMANLLWDKDDLTIDGNSYCQEVSDLIKVCDGKAVSEIAIEARVNHKLRHAPLIIIVEMCKYAHTKPYVVDTMDRVITRPDMMMDFLSLYWKDKKTPLCNVAKKGLAKCFHHFNEYQYAKYDRDLKVKLRDVMFLCHPKPQDEEEKVLFQKIASRTLDVPETWEVLLSNGMDKGQAWRYLIEEHKLGGLATLRNIRNMKEAGLSHFEIEKALTQCSKTMLLPKDWYMTWKANPDYASQINDAMVSSYKTLPKLKGKTLLILDNSGSMSSSVSKGMKRMDASRLMAILAMQQCEYVDIVMTAGNDGTRVHKSFKLENPKFGFDLLEQISTQCDKNDIGWGGIFTRQCLEWCHENVGTEYDRIIVFSDSQDCDFPDKRIPNPYGKHNYICDVSSCKHGVNFKGKWTAEISGFSDRFIQYISAFEGVENSFEEG